MGGGGYGSVGAFEPTIAVSRRVRAHGRAGAIRYLHRVGIRLRRRDAEGCPVAGVVALLCRDTPDTTFVGSLGRRRIYIIGKVLTGLFGWVDFMMLDTRAPFSIFAAINWRRSSLVARRRIGVMATVLLEDYT